MFQLPPIYPGGYGPPWWYGPQQQPEQREPEDDIPDRVKIAVNVAMRYSEKTTPKVAGDNRGFFGEQQSVEVLEAAKLDTHENRILMAAGRCLERYFDGTLKPNAAEKAKAARRQKAAEEEANRVQIVLKCPACAEVPPHMRAGCNVCKGSGAIVAAPVNHPGVRVQ